MYIHTHSHRHIHSLTHTFALQLQFNGGVNWRSCKSLFNPLSGGTLSEHWKLKSFKEGADSFSSVGNACLRSPKEGEGVC